MLSLAVKNTILVVLIILILHFMLLNYINDRRTEAKTGRIAEAYGGEPVSKPSQVINNVDVPAAEVAVDNCTATSKKKNEKEEEDLLYNYVFTTECQRPKETVISDGSLKKSHSPSECHQRNLEGALLINEYDEENSMSGGNLKLLDGISAFDTLAASYQAY